MKKHPKRRRTPSEPQVILVGNSGKINRDSRLCRLRMTKKFKNFLMEQEYEESEKTSEVTKLVEQYKNLLCLILSLKQENANDSNRDLLKELEEIKADYRERLIQIDPLFMKRIPNALQRSVQEILDCYSKLNGQHKPVRNRHEQRKPLKRSKKFRGDGNPYCGKTRTMSVTVKNINKSNQANERPISKIEKSEPCSGVTRNSWSGCYKSQIFVRTSNAQLQAINIDLFSLGSNLHDVLAEELEEDVTKCNLMFGAKEVVKEKTLFEQEIYHGSTVDVVLPLYGGMGRKKKKHTKASKNSKATLKPDKGGSLEEVTKTEKEQVPMKNEIQEAEEISIVNDEPKKEKLPESCTQQKVQHWFENAAKVLDINVTEVSNLKSLNLNVLNILKKEDWLRRSPSFGDALFNMWQKNQEARALPTPFHRKKENVEDNLNEPEDSSLNVDRQQEDVLKRSGIVFFGEVEDEMAESFSMEDFENDDVSPKLQFGSVITVTGVCSSTPHMQGNVTTMLIRDDPQGAASYYNELKILIIGCEGIKQKIDILSQEIKLDMLLGVKGRVEKMEEEDGSDGGQMLKFKLVIDSAEHHGLFSIESKPPKLRRQLSQCWWPVGADIRNSDELNINVGDFIIDNDLERIYCDADISDEQIIQYVVAFKNSFDGEIFVGVEKNAQITGMEVNNGGIKKWRERISMAIGSLLPEANEGADICENIQEASVLVDKRRCFVCVLPLYNDKNKALGWIHVPKGEARVYFIKASDVHAYKRAGAENKRIINYEDLFYSLESLASRQIEPAFEEEYDEEDLEQDGVSKYGKEQYKVLDKVAHESQHHELKMIFGDNPVNTIQEKYLGPYACGFLNSDEGKIFFGVEEDEKSKNGHIVGIVLSKQERKDLSDKMVTTLKNFYPPVSKSQFNIKFHPVCIPTELIVKARGGGKFYAKIVGPADEVGKKWPKFIQKEIKVKSRSAVIPIRSQCFCVVASKKTSEGRNLTGLVEKFVNENSKFTLNSINEIELKDILKNLFVVELSVSRSPYPIHMVKTIDTYVLSKDKENRLCACKLSREDLMDRFKLDSTSEFDVEKFLGHVKNFENAGNSFILITSPFDLPKKERDLFGLVIPKWTLAIDLDQNPKQTGHLYEIFQKLNDCYQAERGRFLKTPLDTKLDLNPKHAVCWLAARGYREDENSLSEDSHAKWIKKHKTRVSELLNDDLKTNVKPNRLNVVVLWDEGHETLVESLRTILEDVIGLNGDDSTVVTFVCASPKARSDISSKIVVPLQEDNFDTISEERVHVAPPYVLARFLSLKLPSPYRSEDACQVPHKKGFSSGGSQIIPQILPQRLRQNLAGYIKVMYMKREKAPDEKTLNKERMNFFSGSAITEDGLQGKIAIQRTVMNDLRKKFNALSSDKKSHVSLIFVKVDRGAGSTTMCLQFLYEQHRDFPCAQLIEIKNGLESHIEEMNKKTRLPLVLFVDENIAHLQEFLEFKKKVERRNVNVIFILIEPREVLSDAESTRKPLQRSRTKSARDTSLYGPSPYKLIELRRTLDEDEMEVLVNVLSVLAKGKKKELFNFKEKARRNDRTGTFANFSLLAFGSNFKGLDKYVKLRLTLADECQKNILAFLSLTHVFTDYSLPANALVHFLNKREVILEEELKDKYLQELLSPRNPDSDSRRISFHEVAREILKQLSAASSKKNSGDDSYWEYIKSISVTMARHVLSKYIVTKKIDRLTRKLFVTNEYESEKFSQLIRSMRAKNRDTARDTLKELVEVFNEKERHSSIRAHLQAHLANYYMIEYNDFEEAKELIEAAISEQRKDPLLHQIHGDIIRRYVVHLCDNLKGKEDMEDIVSYACKSSECFKVVRSVDPKMSHGYISEAMVRIHVMEAGIKLMGSRTSSFVDYLIQRIDEIKKSDAEDISPNSRYLLGLISDAYEYLDERCIDFEIREKWKETYLTCIGDLENLTRLCNKINQEKNCTSFSKCSAWLHEMLVQTQILHKALEIENKILSPQEIELKLKKMEEYGVDAKFGERFMKFWIRYSRQRLSVPSLQEVKKRVNEWSAKMKKKRVVSPQAEFYNFVVHVLMALKYPADSEKMDTAERLTKRQQCKRYKKKDDFDLPYEWLHPKNGRHIESIDCLLHHDDFIKGTNISSKSDPRKPIEGSLFEKNITQWEGTVTTARSDYQGVITFKRRLPVRFVPISALPSMPSPGDTVKFCLSFDGFGLSAWRVIGEAGRLPSHLSDITSRYMDDSPSEYDEQEDMQEEDFVVAPSLSSIDIQEPDKKQTINEYKSQQPQSGAVKKRRTKWDEYNEQRMYGIVSYSNHELGFGFIENADIEDKLFFHASQLRVPVTNFEGKIVEEILLDFKVEKLKNRIRAADIGVLKDENLRQTMLEKLRKKKQTMAARNERDTSCHEGSVVMFDKDKGFGFIKPDYDKSGKDIFFGRKNLITKGLLPKDGDRVQFCVIKTSDGRYEAKDILVEVVKEKTLFEQEIYHGSTVDVVLPLYGEASAIPTSLDSEKENVEDNLNEPEDSSLNVDRQQRDVLKRSRKVFFGKVEDEMAESFSVEDFENDDVSPKLQFGSVITVTGVCSSTPHMQGNVTTMFIRDDPQGAASYHNELKILITGYERIKQKIDILSKEIKMDMLVGVRGRVEKMEEEDGYDGSQMLKFKLVIDSVEHHGLFSVETNKPQKLRRQLSQCWWPVSADVENGDELNINIGDFIVDNDLERVYCDAGVSDEQILQYVVAFKNSFDGEIFVGVKENAQITGMEVNNDGIRKWRERISMAIGSLLPEANEGAVICQNIHEASALVDSRRCFVCVLPLCNDTNKALGWIHVPKGEAKVYFRKASDVHAYKRTGAENKRIINYEDLFYSLESLASRQIEPVFNEGYDEEDDEQEGVSKNGKQEYKVLEKVAHESQHLELKMIFGDNPVNTIQERYLGPYACGFLNSDGGNIFFGVEEDEKSKNGHIVGIVLSKKDRKDLVEITVRTLRNFYPPVNRNQFKIIFNPVRIPLEFIVKAKGEGKMYAKIIGPSDEVGKKWPKFIQKEVMVKSRSAVITLRSQCFCVVASKQTSDGRNLTELVEKFVNENSKKFKLQSISEVELTDILKNIFVVELYVSQSRYPIHMIKTIDTYVLNKDKEKQLCLCKLSRDDLMDRFKLDSAIEFDVKKFLRHVKNFDNAGNSFILITSPFDLPEKERDLYGLVIPKWTLTIDLDQDPKQTGHLYQIFHELNDRYQTERDRFLKTPLDAKLDLNPNHGVCWLAARGYRDVEASMPGKSHAKWLKKNNPRIRDLLNDDFKTNVKPNQLNVVVLWDEGHTALVETLRTLLDDVITSNEDDSTVITFVCTSPKARLDINSKIVVPLQEDNLDTISEERVHVAPPYVLARFLSLKLPSPYRPEVNYQVPHKKGFRSGTSQNVPQILPQRLRQNLSGYLEVMYMKKGRNQDEKAQNKERMNFFSGSAITYEGLQANIAIQRTVMDELRKKFKALSSDKKSHVSLIFLKVDRGAGSTTMCLQFLYELHRDFPCAQLVEIKNGLESDIEEMNKKTRLPLVLFVDKNIAHLQHFLEFKKKVERRNVNVIFILIEPREVFFAGEPSRKSQQKSRTKSVRDTSLYGPSPYKVIQLKRKLDDNEMEQLVKVLSILTKGKKKELSAFKEKAKRNDGTGTFANFSLLAFGNNFKGLEQYVQFRLSRADERQKNILAFLSLTHVFTDYSLPANALVQFLNKREIILEEELKDKYLQELLSPRNPDSDSRRISFREVAREILKQLSAASNKRDSGDDAYWEYIKNISVTMAKHVLSKYIATKKIDRLTRKLFVTSEYDSEKFSQLIRGMRDKNRDTARDTMKQLVDVFDEKERHSSIRAHLRAHLAKYHLTEYNNFEEAKVLIETAIGEQKQDPLLHHIHGDITRLYVLDLCDNLKNKADMENIVSYARQSSKCFEVVRTVDPKMSHGYISDAMVRINVMQASIRLIPSKNTSFVDYLIERIDEIKECDDEDISPNSRYLLSLISDAYGYLDERCIDFEMRDKWKETYLSCIGDLENLTRLCDKIQQERNCNSFKNCSAWMDEMLVQTQILHHALEIEHKDLSPEETELKLKKMEEYDAHAKYGDRFMKFWIRYSRQRLFVPNLQEVKKRVNEWSNKMKKQRVASPQAEFYNFVVHVLLALKYPTDSEKMDIAEKLTKRQQSKRYNKKNDFVFPYEWLHPSEGRHIESIDCLLHHDDLIKGTDISSKFDRRKPIEGSLFEKNITQWEGTVTTVRSDYQGVITFKKRLPVRFVPLNALPSMPSPGDSVKFCLSFDGFGLSAWRVIGEAVRLPSHLSVITNSKEDDSPSEYDEHEDVQEDLENFVVAPSLSSIDIQEPDEIQSLNEHKRQQPQWEAVKKKRTKWDEYNEERMQGIVSSTNPETGFGFIENADIEDKLFFHAAQLRVPVKDLEGNIVKNILLDFKVEIVSDQTRAADIHVLKDEKRRKTMLELLRKKKDTSHSKAMRENVCNRTRQEGSVIKFDNSKGFGFIKPDYDKSGDDLYFSRKNLTTRGMLPKNGDRVQFCVAKTFDGRSEAKDILVQNKSTSYNSWDDFIGAGIQEGFVNSTTDNGGTINSKKVTRLKNNLPFGNKDILNKQKTVDVGTKMHFEVIRRGGRCVAVKINVIDTSEEMVSEARSLALQFMSTHPCCIRVIPYENDAGEGNNQPITMCLYVSTNGKGIPTNVQSFAQQMFVNYRIEFIDLQKRPLSKIFTPLPSSQKRREKELSDLSRKIEENLHLFEKRLNVTAVQASYKVTNSVEQDILCVAVFVLGKRKVPAGETDIKKIKYDNHVFDDVEFDVLEGYYQPAIDAKRASYVDPLRAGFGIGVEGVRGAGTLGGFLEDETGKHYILSNKHVLHPSDAGDNDVILQPSQLDYDMMCCEAKEHLKIALESKEIPGSKGLSFTQEDKDKINETRPPSLLKKIEKRVKEARKKLEDIESEIPRAIGKYVHGLQGNAIIELGEKKVQIFVDAAIAELEETEEKDLKLMHDMYENLYGFEKEQNTTKPNGEIVTWEAFIDQLRRKETSFCKFGRTTGFTDDGRIDNAVQEMFVNIRVSENTVPEDGPIVSTFSHIPYRFCKDCKFSDDCLKEVDYNQKSKLDKCTKCQKLLKDDDEIRTIWARNNFVIRKRRKVFCDLGDSGALVFDEQGNAWGLVHGIFENQSADFTFCLASPLCLTLKALEQASGKKELKLWRVRHSN